MDALNAKTHLLHCAFVYNPESSDQSSGLCAYVHKCGHECG